MDAQIRRKQSLLISSGYAVIMFGIWSIIRLILMVFLDTDSFMKNYDFFSDEYDTLEVVIACVVVVTFLLIDLLFRMHLGRRAIREGLGHKQNSMYIIISLLYVVLSIVVDVNTLRDASSIMEDHVISYTIIDISTCIPLIVIAISALQLRTLNRQFEEVR